MPSQGVTNVANAIINKINNLISSHNNNSNAHQDIREDIPSYTSDLNNDSGFITISSIPSASSATPSADTTSGSVGTGTAWARSDHTHPKSSLYAEASHTHQDVLKKSNTVGLVKNDGTIVQSGTGANNWATGNHTHEEYIQNQEFYFDGDDFVIISDEQTITKTLTIVWIDNKNALGLRPRYLQATIGYGNNDCITTYLSEESDWSVSIPDSENGDWKIPSVPEYTGMIDWVDDTTTIITYQAKARPPSDSPGSDEELNPGPIKVDVDELEP